MDPDATREPMPDQAGFAPLHVCHVGPYPARGGGIASVTRMLIEHQQADPDLTVEAIPTSVEGGGARKLFAFLKSIAAIRARCQHAEDLVLHVHAAHSRSFERKAWLMRVAERYDVPVLLHIHAYEFENWYEGLSTRSKRSIQKRLDRAGRIVVVSNSWNDYFSRLTTTPVTTVHNAVETAYFTFDRNYDDPPTFLVLFLGGVGLRRKGAFDLLEAIHRVNESNPLLSLRVIIAGYGEIDEARSWIATRGLSDTVEVPGWIERDKKDRLLRQAHIFVLPSYHEGLPISLLESMASGLPTIVTPVGGIPEAIQNEHNGLLIQPGDVGGLSEALQRLLGQRSLRERLGRQAQQTVLEAFDLPVAVATFKALYGELHAAASGRRPQG